ncbi:MAG: hypothetical protein EGR21_05810 [Faecalibacterium prausnitzii]|nr:hypothetical protein [Faecalibacterium prausnitzii]
MRALLLGWSSFCFYAKMRHRSVCKRRSAPKGELYFCLADLVPPDLVGVQMQGEMVAAGAAANFHFTNAARTVTITIKAVPKGRSFSSTARNRSDSAGAAQNALIRRFFA